MTNQYVDSTGRAQHPNSRKAAVKGNGRPDHSPETCFTNALETRTQSHVLSHVPEECSCCARILEVFYNCPKAQDRLQAYTKISNGRKDQSSKAYRSEVS